MTYVFMNEKIPGRGEDAVFHGSALTRVHSPNDVVQEQEVPAPVTEIHWAGVCDGLGGKGSNKYRLPDGSLCTEARIASNFYAEYLNQAMEHYAADFADCLNGDDIADVIIRIREDLYKDMLQELAQCEAEGQYGMPVSARAVHRFPSTLAMMIRIKTPDHTYFASLWSGDSRCYILDRRGLHQISEDTSLDHDDALQDMRSPSSSPMKERLGLDLPDILIHFHVRTPEIPSAGICFTDGVYNMDSFNSPMRLEEFLLVTMEATSSFEEWLECMKGLCEKRATDDSSCAVLPASDEMTFEMMKIVADTCSKKLGELMQDCPVRKEADPEYQSLLENLTAAKHARANVQDDFVNAPEFEEECIQWLDDLVSGHKSLPYPNRDFTALLASTGNSRRLREKACHEHIMQLCGRITEICRTAYRSYAEELLAQKRKELEEQEKKTSQAVTDACNSEPSQYDDMFEMIRKDIAYYSNVHSNRLEALEELSKYADELRDGEYRLFAEYGNKEVKLPELEFELSAEQQEEVDQLIQEVKQEEKNAAPGLVIYSQCKEQMKTEVKQFLLMGKVPFAEERWKELCSEADQKTEAANLRLNAWKRAYDNRISEIWEIYRREYEKYLRG